MCIEPYMHRVVCMGLLLDSRACECRVTLWAWCMRECDNGTLSRGVCEHLCVSVCLRVKRVCVCSLLISTH